MVTKYYWDKILIVFLFIFFVLVSVEHQYISLYADDFGRKLQAGSISGIFIASINEWNLWSGRLFSSLLSYYFASGHFDYWRLVNPIIMVALVVLILRVSETKNANLFAKLSALLFVVSFLLTTHISLSREVFYWMTGSLNYLWPMTVSFAFILYWQKIINGPELVFSQKYIVVILAMLAGITHEQFAPLTLFIVLYIYREKVVNGYKPDRIFFLALFGFLISLTLLYSAPGNFKRLHSQTSGNSLYYTADFISILNLRFREIISVIQNSELSEMFANSFIVFLLLIVISLSSLRTLTLFKRIFYCFVLALAGVASLLIKPNSPWEMSTILESMSGSVQETAFSINTVGAYAFWIAIFAFVIHMANLISKQDKNCVLKSMVLATVFSLIIMVVFPYSPNRSYFATYVYMITAIAYLIQRIESKRMAFILFLISLVYSVYGFKEYINLIYKYRINKMITVTNEERINSAVNNNSSSIVLYKLADESYGFDLPYQLFADQQDSSFNQYYGLKEGVKVYWVQQ